MPVRGNSGTSLLVFNTIRQPDTDRGKDITHLTLTLPTNIGEEITKWEKGERPELDPRDAAKMLWSTRVGSFLDGTFDGWKNVPSVNLLLPVWKGITSLPESSWPKNQPELLKMAAEIRGGGISPEEFAEHLMRLVGDLSAADLLNDLVLIFKYAAIGSQRPIHLAADLYRLARAILEKDKGLLSTKGKISKWLKAPLIVPRVLTAPLGPTGPKLPNQDDILGETQKPQGPKISFDTQSQRYRMIVKQLETELDDVEKIEVNSGVLRALRRIDVTDTATISRALGGERTTDSRSSLSSHNRIIRNVATSTATHRMSRFISTTIGGASVRVNVGEMEKRAERQREDLAKSFVMSLPAELRSRVNALAVDGYQVAFPGDYPNITSSHPPIPSGPSYLEPAGRTDLLLVRQTTTGYRRAEISYIENVLIGEKRKRNHTKRVLTRDELFESTEQESEETTDLQTTDSSELSNEVNEVVSEKLAAEGSVEATYRGPTKVVAKVTGSFETSTENTAKVVSDFATEIVERAVTRIFERTKRETKSLFEQEIVEENRHHFERESTADEHVSGVYQYLERVSWAKIFSYGERDLYDILVPEPAALIWKLSIPAEDIGDEIEPPNPELFESLNLENIEEKRDEIIRAYQVIDLDAPPPETLPVMFTFSATGRGENAKYATNKELKIEEGYIIDNAKFRLSGERDEGFDINGGVIIGPQIKPWAFSEQSGVAQVEEFTFTPPLAGPKVGIAINAENFQSLAGIISMDSIRTEKRYKEWALEAYGRVATKFEQLQREYELAKIRAEATQPIAEVDLPVGARRRLKKMVRTELQRAAIGIMRNAPLGPLDFDLINEGGIEPGPPYPTTDISALKAAEAEIRFLQQAFEWEHLSWTLYPYFWGRQAGVPGWENMVVQDHPDPDFAAFLNSGAARLQISVRPGFENLVKHFMETGEAYEGNGVPKMGDEGYVPFIDEQINSLGGPGDEVSWPPESPIEWEIVAPTPLVLVRKVGEQTKLPEWGKATGVEIE